MIIIIFDTKLSVSTATQSQTSDPGYLLGIVQVLRTNQTPC